MCNRPRDGTKRELNLPNVQIVVSESGRARPEQHVADLAKNPAGLSGLGVPDRSKDSDHVLNGDIGNNAISDVRKNVGLENA